MASLADARYEEQIRCVHVRGKMMSVSRITLRFGRRHHDRNWDMGSLPITPLAPVAGKGGTFSLGNINIASVVVVKVRFCVSWCWRGVSLLDGLACRCMAK